MAKTAYEMLSQKLSIGTEEDHTNVEMYAITSGVIFLIPLISAFDSFWLAENDRAPGSAYTHPRPADGPQRIVIPH